MMNREAGKREFPLWLIGDSNPPQWESSLNTPLDPRHPVRHNIWTALLDVIQDKVYRASKLRIDTSAIYIRNAVDDPVKKPATTSNQWSKASETEILNLENMLKTYKPILLFCFGAFAYEFTRRAIGEQERRKYGYWGARKLGEEYRYRIGAFDIGKTNVILLLHRSISSGKFVESHEYYCN